MFDTHWAHINELTPPSNPWGPPTVVTNLKLGAEKIFPLKIVDVFIEMAKTHKKSYFVFIFWFFGS